MSVSTKIIFNSDEANEAREIAGRQTRVWNAVPGYGSPAGKGPKARRVVPGYGGGSGKNRARGRVKVPGYGATSVTLELTP